MRYPLDVVIVGNPGDPPRFRQSTYFRAIGLDDIDGMALDEGAKALPPRQPLSGGDRHRSMAAQFDEAVNNGLIVLRAAGVPPAFCNTIGCDLHTIALEVQPDLGG